MDIRYSRIANTVKNQFTNRSGHLILSMLFDSFPGCSLSALPEDSCMIRRTDLHGHGQDRPSSFRLNIVAI